MEVIELAIIIGLAMIAVLSILIGVLAYKLRRVQKHKERKEAKKSTEVKTERTEVKTEEPQKRKKLFSDILTKRRKSIEAKQYGIWK